MTIDYKGFLAQLEAERTATEKELGRLDKLIAALRLLLNDDGVKATVLRDSRLRSDAPTPEAWAQARKQYEDGVAIAKIAQWIGRSSATVYDRSRREHWKRRQHADEPSLVLAGRVRCPNCASMTDRDPCEFCHKPMTE